MNQEFKKRKGKLGNTYYVPKPEPDPEERRGRNIRAGIVVAGIFALGLITQAYQSIEHRRPADVRAGRSTARVVPYRTSPEAKDLTTLVGYSLRGQNKIEGLADDLWNPCKAPATPYQASKMNPQQEGGAPPRHVAQHVKTEMPELAPIDEAQRVNEIHKIIDEECARYNSRRGIEYLVDPELMYQIARWESGNDPSKIHYYVKRQLNPAWKNATRKERGLLKKYVHERVLDDNGEPKVSAWGLCGITEETAKEHGASTDELLLPRKNAKISIRVVGKLLQRYKGDVNLVLAAYNAGPGAVDRAGGVPKIEQTQSFVYRAGSSYAGLRPTR